MGVVVRRYIYRFPHTTYPYFSCICSFLQQHPYFLFIKKKNGFIVKTNIMFSAACRKCAVECGAK